MIAWMDHMDNCCRRQEGCRNCTNGNGPAQSCKGRSKTVCPKNLCNQEKHQVSLILHEKLFSKSVFHLLLISVICCPLSNFRKLLNTVKLFDLEMVPLAMWIYLNSLVSFISFVKIIGLILKA